LASTEYADGVDEFKIRLNTCSSEVVKPYRVKESPVNLNAKSLRLFRQELKVELGI
jgi:hypothetical protein